MRVYHCFIVFRGVQVLAFVAVPAGGSISNSVFGDVDLALSLCKVKTQKSLRDFRVFGFWVIIRSRVLVVLGNGACIEDYIGLNALCKGLLVHYWCRGRNR